METRRPGHHRETRRAGPQRTIYRRWHATAAALFLLVACGCDEPGSADDLATWLTESEYQFSDAPDQDVLFSIMPYLRVDPDRNRILVLDYQEAVLSAWTPDGSLIFVVGGKGGGPGEFMFPTGIHFVEDGGFYVREGSGKRFTYYTADGVLERAVTGSTASLTYDRFGLDLRASTGDGGYLAVPRIGWGGADDPNLKVDRYPLLRVQRADRARWFPPEPIFWMSLRNTYQFVGLREEDPWVIGQLFGDLDHAKFEPGVAVVMRRNGGPGAVELIELNPDGDTIWLRQLQIEPRRLTPERIREEADSFAAVMQLPGIPPSEVRQAWEESLYKPEYLPAAIDFRLTSSGEVWLKSFERSDTLRAYYSVHRGDMSAEPRRILVPEGLRVFDATDTHVWGIGLDALGRPHVVGRRLVSPS